jgi:hypothetical protein
MNTSKSKANSKSAAEPRGYAGHKSGSRKGVIHELFDREGAEVAWTRGIKLKLKEGTLRSWFGAWNRSAPTAAAKAQPKSTKKSKAAAEQATPEPAPATTA